MTTNLIDHNPMLREPLLTILAISAPHMQVNRPALEARALEVWCDKFIQSPTVSIDILVRNKALIEQLHVDGNPYNGTLADLALDDNVAEDAIAESRLTITDAGRQLIEAYAPNYMLQTLLNEKPHYRNIFDTILLACNVEHGCSRVALEHTINTLPQLKPDPATKQTAVYPQYFIDALESAGGISWQGTWHTTGAGKIIIAA